MLYPYLSVESRFIFTQKQIYFVKIELDVE